jgi:hypothetical protein
MKTDNNGKNSFDPSGIFTRSPRGTVPEAGYGGKILVGGKILREKSFCKNDTTKDTKTEHRRSLTY